MKKLTRMKIINWHYFWNELITFDQIVFLTGANAAGKSTLIDAMQLLLLGDTSGRYFNKAAMDKSQRTLKGYLKGELGDAEDGGFHYLRTGRFTSYLAMEFYDDRADKYFTFGCVFDLYDEKADEHRFFSIEDKLPENEFIVNNVPLDAKALLKYYKEELPEAGFKFFDTNKQYTENLKRRFGGLKDKYFALFKKAVSFTPITDIETFITEYVTDPQANINIEPMQENLLQYKKLENEASMMRIRIERLTEIEKIYQSYVGHRENLSLFSYITERAQLEIDRGVLQQLYAQIDSNTARAEAIILELADIYVNISELEKKKYKLINDRLSSDAYRLTDELLENKKENEAKLRQLNEEINEIVHNLSVYCDRYVTITSHLIEPLSNVDLTLLEKDLADDLQKLLEISRRLNHQSGSLKDIGLMNLGEINAETLSSWRENISSLKLQAAALTSVIGKAIPQLESELLISRQQQGGTSNKPYDFALLSIKNELAQQLQAIHNRPVKVEILADLIDIKNKIWANAIEGYLAGQKYNLIVEEAYYLPAYDIFKNLLAKYNFYNTQLVDIGAILSRNYQTETQSLAEEIETDHSGAKAYISFLIGRLKKCQTPVEARSSGNGITPDTDIYRNFTMGRLHPNSYRRHVIGRQSTASQIEAQRQEMTDKQTMLTSYRLLQHLLQEVNALEVINSYEINSSIQTLSRVFEIKGYEQTIAYIDSELNKHDLSEIASYEQRISALDEDIENLREDQARLNEEKGVTSSRVEDLKKDRIPQAKQKVLDKETRLLNEYNIDLVEDKAEPLFKKLMEEEGKSHLTIIADYNSLLSSSQYLVSNIFGQLQRLRREYVRDYRLTLETDGKENSLYDVELSDLRDVKLPEYESKIIDAYQKATKQFKDDFISKLRSAIDNVIDQIEDLNQALKLATFGNDSYQFVVKPSAVYRRYYDMIKDDMLLTMGEDDSEFLEKYHEVMNDLFKQIVDVRSGDQNAAVLENVAKFTDYRSYLDFDLLVHDKEGGIQHLSKVIRKKSGGETQTPFYISVLASFAQLYRVNETGELSNSIRLIIFDEAFSKMDRGRIQQAITLLRDFGFQAIVSAPSEKIGDISPLVNETLVVLKDKKASRVHLYAKAEDVRLK